MVSISFEDFEKKREVRILTIFGNVYEPLHTFRAPVSLVEDLDGELEAVPRLELPSADLGANLIPFTHNPHRMASHVLTVNGELQLVVVHSGAIGVVLPTDPCGGSFHRNTEYLRRYSEIER